MRTSLAKNKDIPTFFGEVQLKGEKKEIDFKIKVDNAPIRFYKHPNGELWQGDTIEWLKSLNDESVEHTLKYPSHPQAETSQYGNGKNGKHVWEPNPLGAKPKDVLEIPTTCNGMHEKTPHPTQKPEELLRKIIFASYNIGDVVLDPFCGSGTTHVPNNYNGNGWLATSLQNIWSGYLIGLN